MEEEGPACLGQGRAGPTASAERPKARERRENWAFGLKAEKGENFLLLFHF
jgi:hypothetical protein